MINILGFDYIIAAYSVIRWHHNTSRSAFNVAILSLALERVHYRYFSFFFTISFYADSSCLSCTRDRALVDPISIDLE